MLFSAAPFGNPKNDRVRYHEKYLFLDVADNHRACLNIRGYISPEVFIDEMLLAAYPQLYLGAKVGDIIIVHSVENDGRAVRHSTLFHHLETDIFPDILPCRS